MITESIDAAEVAGDRAEDEADREADRDGDDADQQRVAGAVDDPRELVAPERVEAEPVVGRRARAAAAGEPREILAARVLRRDAAARRSRR